MIAIRDTSLVREQSRPAVYLVVGDVKFWIVDPTEFAALGFDWAKVRVVPDGSLFAFTERRLLPAPRIRASDVHFDCGNDFDSLTGRWHFNCKPGASIIRRDVLVAGWLMAAPYVHDEGYGIEDVFYNLWLDARFIDRMYGANGLSSALVTAACRGNPPAASPLPLPTLPPAQPGGQRQVTFNSFIIPNNSEDLHCELNAWHQNDSGALFSRHWVGRGTPPAFWGNPLPQDRNSWFPYDPLNPDGTGPLRGGDYALLRGTLWQDTAHGTSTGPWDTVITVNHGGWLEMHPPDSVTRVRGPGPNARVTSRRIAICTPSSTGPVIPADLRIEPDFPPSRSSRYLEVRTVDQSIDDRLTIGPPFSSIAINRQPRYVDVHVEVQPTGSQQGRLKASWHVFWRELDQYDRVWVNEGLPAGAAAFADAESWDWTTDPPGPFVGTVAHRSASVGGLHQHYFWNASAQMAVTPRDTLFAMTFLDPDNPPSEVMLQWRTSDWLHRGYWGDNLIGWGADGTSQRRYMGPLPPAGEWVRLEVPANTVGLGGATVNGMAFTLWGGRATWDYAGVRVPPLALRASVRPSLVIEGRRTITVSAVDADNGAAVAGRVLMDGTDVGATNTAITRDFVPGRIVFTARCPGYPDASATLTVQAEKDSDKLIAKEKDTEFASPPGPGPAVDETPDGGSAQPFIPAEERELVGEQALNEPKEETKPRARRRRQPS